MVGKMWTPQRLILAVAFATNDHLKPHCGKRRMWVHKAMINEIKKEEEDLELKNLDYKNK